MPKIRRCHLPESWLTHLVLRVRERNISREQIVLLARWLDTEPAVPEGRWGRRFKRFMLWGEGGRLQMRGPASNISREQMFLLARWLETDPVVPEGRWFRRFAGFILCGEGELMKPFLQPGQLPDGAEII